MEQKADIFSSRRPMVILVALAAAVVFANTLWHGFVFDDGFQVLGNRWIRDAGSLPEIFTTPAWGFDPERSSNYYRPLMHLVFMIDFHLFGLTPWGYHLVNIIVHAVNSILVYLLARHLFFGDEGHGEGGAVLKGAHLALASALLFALHPVHTEAVAWVSAIPELGFTLFFLLSLYLYIMAYENNGRWVLPLSWLSFILALLFKETGVMLFFVVVAFDISFKKKGASGWGLALRRYLPYIIILIFYIIVKLLVSGGLVPKVQHEELSGFQYFINIFPLVSDYIRLIFFPVDLNAFYVFHPVLSVLDLRVLASIIVIAPFVVLFVINLRRKDRAAAFAWLLALLPLLPALYIAGAGARGSAFAERYLYLPSAGFLIFIIYWFACFLRRFVKRRANVIFVIVIVLACGVFSAATFARNNVWKDNYSLWKDSAQKTLDSDLVYVNLGSAADERGYKAEALSAYESALSLNPNSTEAHNNLGVLYFETKEYELSLKNYEEALEETTKQSDRALINENMGNVYYAMGSLGEAVGRYKEAVRIKGAGLKDASLLNKLGIALARSGRTKEARESFQKALDLDPSHIGARKNLERAAKPLAR